MGVEGKELLVFNIMSKVEDITISISAKHLIGIFMASLHPVCTVALPNNLVFIFFPNSGFQ